ncbi:hypothetical protein FRB95_007236 [Tulasnella sp. JGI-2019a]|nr:hypothetical protein FRB95_007236 [Tulasnella sp. JGI-2019a]
MTKFSCAHLCTGEDALNVSSASLIDDITLDITERNRTRAAAPADLDDHRTRRRSGRKKAVAFAERHTSFYFLVDEPVSRKSKTAANSFVSRSSTAATSSHFTNSASTLGYNAASASKSAAHAGQASVNDATAITADRTPKKRLAVNHPYDQRARAPRRAQMQKAQRVPDRTAPSSPLVLAAAASVGSLAWYLAAAMTGVAGSVADSEMTETEAATSVDDDEPSGRRAGLMPGAYPASSRGPLVRTYAMLDVTKPYRPFPHDASYHVAPPLVSRI